MDEYNTKDWWTSKGIWGTIVAGVGGVLSLVTAGHFGFSPTDQQFLSTALWSIVNAVSGIVTLAGAVLAWYGRWKATQVISDKVIPTLKQ